MTEEPSDAGKQHRPSYSHHKIDLLATGSELSDGKMSVSSEGDSSFIPIVLTIYASVAIFKTLFTELMLQGVHFPFPVALSTLSCIVTPLACLLVFVVSPSSFQYPSKSGAKGLFYISLLTALDLGLSNIALSLISVALQQVIKATACIWVVLLEVIVLKVHHGVGVWLCILCMVVGAPLSAIGSAAEDFNLSGCILMVVATLTGGIKYVTAHEIIKIHKKELGTVSFLLWLELTMLIYMVPWTIASGELPLIAAWDGLYDPSEWALVVSNALMGGLRAFVTFLVLRHCSALQLVTTNVASQCLVILLGILVFETQTSPLLLTGIAITLAGYVGYSYNKATKGRKH